MKKLLLFTITALSINANAQWVQQNSGTTNILTSIFFPSNTVGYSMVETGYLRKTTNGGSNWNQVGGQNDMYGQIYFTSLDTGFATGNRGVLKTMDGGVTWVDNFPDSVISLSVCFQSSNVGYLATSNFTFDTAFIYKTINGGNSWFRVATQSSIMGAFIQYIYFVNPTTGFLLLYGDGIYKTTDGGITWVQKSNGNQLYSIQFPTPSIGYAVGDFEMLKSVDGGETWNTMVNTNPQPLNCVYFTNNSIGFVGGGDGISSGAIEKTVNGGGNWSVDLSNVQTFYSMSFPSPNRGYACGTNGTIYKLDLPVGIEEESANNSINLYPNPTSGSFQLSLSQGIKVNDVLGNEILAMVATRENNITIDISKYAQGVYYVRAVNEDGQIEMKKLIKE